MKNYLFVDMNNGHERTYHPFVLDRSISQEKANEVMEQYRLARRMGIDLEHFLSLLGDNDYYPSYWMCTCCKNIVKQIPDPILSDWDIIEGISGNY
jgi:hypothetical protein